MKKFLLTATALIVAAPAAAQDHASIAGQIETLRREVAALRSTVERQRRSPVMITKGRYRYFGAGEAAANRAAKDACKELGYSAGRAHDGAQEGSRRILTDYMCWDPER